MEAKKKFIHDEIVPRIIKGDFIRGNNSIIIKLPCVLNDSKNNFEIPKEEFINEKESKGDISCYGSICNFSR